MDLGLSKANLVNPSTSMPHLDLGPRWANSVNSSTNLPLVDLKPSKSNLVNSSSNLSHLDVRTSKAILVKPCSNIQSNHILTRDQLRQISSSLSQVYKPATFGRGLINRNLVNASAALSLSLFIILNNSKHKP